MAPEMEATTGWKVFNDSVHGHFELHPLCVLVIDTPQFQRLRHIKQLGGTYYVFPSAAHNRFEHSLGVAYLAAELVSTLRRNQPELNITDTDVVCVSLAGLCHDLGHGPFSHMWETFMDQVRPERHWKHEATSVEMFQYMLEQNGLMENFTADGLTELDITFIKEQIAGPCPDTGKYVGRTGKKAFLYEIISNKRNGIDVDKWDYFCRDSHLLGINISFDYKRCLLYSRVIEVENEGFQICTRDKEVGNMYDLFYTRWVLHRRAYQHRVCRIVERMFCDLLALADPYLLLPDPSRPDSPGVRMSEACDNMGVFSQLTDHVQQLVAQSVTEELEPARRLLRDIHTRRLYKFVCASQPTAEDKREIDTEAIRCGVGSLLQPEDDLEPDDLMVDVISITYGMGNRNPIDCVRFYSKENPNTAMIIRRSDVSPLLPDKFRETYVMMTCRQREKNKVAAARARFEEWSSSNQYSLPSRELWFGRMSPVKGGEDETLGELEQTGRRRNLSLRRSVSSNIDL
ncbi:deoxynucleoside triphosphate triphosphohydrolase SAMHD1-like [Amphibalanus amphitrite]|uniref:deoxynucleoside triphosphate triphosphohydrolase SAMHD1-like n=1 Tax=Amphibalanus amphitrite TaxID=1232801 RepID=UPI001C907F2D|nr:deoxynucleoside triphosphate triphosphohydrolase SAMHD1-like [Amphibalanus amphitrite]XP_043203477.1 deoxynucleoside triphosphate triphosphohydrolase SAMHD1-like [Amphibalanus amphitrite]